MSKSLSKKGTGKTNPKIQVVLADDHTVVRKGLRALLAQSRNIQIIGEARNGEEVLRLVKRRKPHVAILDISMPKMSGLEATRILKQQYPDVKVLILTVHDNQEYIAQMMQAGADGYLLKDAEREELFLAVRTVANGRRFFGTSVSQAILDGILRKKESVADTRTPESPPLSKREAEILQLIAQGLTSRAIAKRLFLSIGTINTHRNHLMKKLGIHDKAGLVHYAIKMGLVKVKA